MLRERNLAVFVDVDNCELNFVHYENILNQASAMGEIVCGKIYGVSEKKNKEIIADAENRAFEMLFPIRNKKRGAKVFDNRIAIDVVELITTNDLIDTVVVVSAGNDLVYLYRLLKKYNVKIVANEAFDQASVHLIDEIIDLGKIEKLALPKKPVAQAQPKARPIVAAPKKEVAAEPVKKSVATPQPKYADKTVSDEETKRTADLLKEIENLRSQNLAAERRAKEAAEAKAREEEKSQTIANEAQELLKQIDEIRGQKDEAVAAPAHEPVKHSPVDSDLIKRIEELRKDSDDDDSSELIAKLQQLFDEE